VESGTRRLVAAAVDFVGPELADRRGESPTLDRIILDYIREVKE
jgi:hypothetical protein